MIPIKISHISDVHIGPYPGPSPLARYQDIERILEWTADRIIEEQVDLVLLCGDCFKDAKVMLDRASQEIASIVRFFRRLSAAGIEVIVISGTPSHDSCASYELMKEMRIPKVRIFTKPDIAYAMQEEGIPVLSGRDNATSETLYPKSDFPIACLPGLNRSSLLTQEEYKGLPPEQVHRIMTDKITQLCMGMSAQMPNDKPKILMAHMTYQNADTGFTDLLMQHEPILTREAVAGFDLVCLGHIHKPQIIDDKVFYSGPIERLSFNEQDIKPGFWIHEVTDELPYDRLVRSKFIETPARKYVTMDWCEGALSNYIDGEYISEDIQDSIVRLRYSCSEETAKLLNRKKLEQDLYDAGAFFVSDIKADIQRTDRARDSEVTEALTPLLALEKWCINQNIDELETKELVSMASRLMEG